MISVNDKKEFFKWFLNSYTLSKKEAAWLISYISSKDNLLEKVHLVNDIDGLPRAILISTECVTRTPFKFYKNKHVTPDVETAFLDIRLNPNEDIYIALFFKERNISPEYANVLEDSPVQKQELVKSDLSNLIAELFLDHSIREFNTQRLYEAIDIAIADGNKKDFYKLTDEYNKILND